MAGKEVPSIADALVVACREAGSQKAVADKLNVSPGVLSRWLLGVAPDPQWWDGLVEVFGVTRERFGLMMLRTLEERAARSSRSQTK